MAQARIDVQLGILKDTSDIEGRFRPDTTVGPSMDNGGGHVEVAERLGCLRPSGDRAELTKYAVRRVAAVIRARTEFPHPFFVIGISRRGGNSLPFNEFLNRLITFESLPWHECGLRLVLDEVARVKAWRVLD